MNNEEKILSLLEQMNGRLDTMDGRLDMLEQGQKEIRADVNVLKTDMNAMQSDVSVLKTDMNAMQSDVSGLKTDMNAMQSDVSVLKTDMAAVKEDIEVMKEDLSPDWLESLEDELEFLSFCSPELALELSESFSDLEEESLSLEAFELELPLDEEAEEASFPLS